MADYLAGAETETTTVSSLIIGTQDIVTTPVTLITGQNLAANTVVARITASGKITAAALGAADGSQFPIGILAHAVDATSADKAAVMYTGGCFNSDALVWGATFDTAVKKAVAFDGTNITIRIPGNSL